VHPGRAYRTLHRAVRPRVIARYLGQILVVVAALTLVPAAVALVGGRLDVAARYAVVIAVFGIAGGAGARIACTQRVQANEALSISALAFLLPGLAMAYPLSAYGIDPLDAVFESISGVTTTGLSTLAAVEGRPRAFLFARAWLQWVGGLGVVVLALAFTIPSGVAAKHLGFDEREMADYVGGTRAHARRILGVYLALTGLGFGLCVLAGMPWFPALATCLAAVSTGGFAVGDTSLAAFDTAQRTAVSVVCLAGAVSFAVYYRGSLGNAWRDARLRALLGLSAFGALLLWIALRSATPFEPGEAGWQAVWLAISAQTTAGFATLPVQDLPSSGKLVLIGGMLVGGEVGSTAGGLKILRLLILFQLIVRRRSSVTGTGSQSARANPG